MMKDEKTERIAIVGMAGRFPGASDIQTYWRNLVSGVESIRLFTDAELEASGVARDEYRHPDYVKCRGVVDGIDLFDAGYFDIGAREAALTDPQHRVLLEIAVTALESAGYDPERTEGIIGVFAGAGVNSYWLTNLSQHDISKTVGAYELFIGNDKDFIPTRISYKLGLRGPSMNVSTACSTSLVAVHLACQNLLTYQCDMALAGGVSLFSRQIMGYRYQEGMILSPDGKTRPFDEAACGVTPGGGAGLFVLKRFTDAVAVGDTILAVIRGTAVNNDGANKAGFTAPSVDGQAAVILDAMAMAEVEPDDIGYIEAHGTATPIGDPIEVAALKQAHRGRSGICRIGSVKSNIGHADAAAGAAGLIKTVMALKEKQLPPTLHFKVPNPNAGLQGSQFSVVDVLTDWKSALPRIAGVSSFGIGGTNAHLIVEEAPESTPPGPSRFRQIVAISAKTNTALEEVEKRLVDHIGLTADPVADVAFTYNIGKRRFPVRSAFIVSDKSAVKLSEGNDSRVNRPVVFMFTGQGGQRPGMGKVLYEQEPVYRAAFDEVACLFTSEGIDVASLINGDAERLMTTAAAQPALFAVEYATARLWISWGITPAAMIGHSIGEIVAAVLAETLSLADGIRLVSVRSAAMDACPPGAMTAVETDETSVAKFLNQRLTVAAVNAEKVIVVSGPVEDIGAFELAMADQAIPFHRLRTSHAFHSPAMASAVAVVKALSLSMRVPAIPYISNLTGDWIGPGEISDPGYWGRHLAGTVRFAAGLDLLADHADYLFLEIGPGAALARLAARRGLVSVATFPYDEMVDETTALMTAIGRLWVSGVAIDWSGYYAGESRHRVAVPTYPFERQRYWIEPEEGLTSGGPITWVPSWRRLPALSTALLEGPVLVIGNDDPLTVAVATATSATIARPATTFSKKTDGYQLPMGDAAAWDLLAENLPAPPVAVIHLLQSGPSVDEKKVDGFYSLVHMARAFDARWPSVPFRITVVTRNGTDVTGEDQVDPKRAISRGPVRVIGQEMPSLSLRLIDMDKPEPGRIVAEAMAVDESIVAWRGKCRWAATWEPVRLPERAGCPSMLREGGVYLITGGSGALGGEAAVALARNCGANVALLARRPIKVEDCPPIPRTDAEAIRVYEAVARKTHDVIDLTSLGDFLPRVEKLCLLYAYDYLVSSGLPWNDGERLSLSELKQRLRVLPKFDKFVNRFVGILVEDGYARFEGDSIDVIVSRKRAPDRVDLLAGMRRDFPAFDGVFSLLDYCANRYGEALSGDIEAIGVLYPNGSAAMKAAAVEAVAVHSYHEMYIDVLCSLIRSKAETARERPLRILEVGAGTGVVTHKLWPRLAGTKVEYWATDLGASFVADLARSATNEGYGFVTCKPFDITADPAAQGIDTGRFDIVFGLDVVHATPDVTKTLERLRETLRPGGALYLLESVVSWRWYDMVWGLAEGWWYFDDAELRSGSPLLSPERWMIALRRAGLVDSVSYASPGSDCALLAAYKPEEVSNDIGRRIEEAGGRWMSVIADVADQAGLAAAVAAVEKHFGQINGVIHAAGVEDTALVATHAAEKSVVEFAAKIDGTDNLLSLFGNCDLDFMLLYSSLSSVIGGLGQSGYAAANSYLDAVACSRPRTVSIGWERWRGQGAARRFEERVGARSLRGGIDVAEGVALLDRILADNCANPHVVISVFDLPGLIRRNRTAEAENFMGTAETPPVVDTSFSPCVTETQRQVGAIWTESLGNPRIGIDDDFTRLGGDSLVGIKIISRIKETFGVALPMRVLFEAPTIGRLAARIDALIGGKATVESETADDIEEGTL